MYTEWHSGPHPSSLSKGTQGAIRCCLWHFQGAGRNYKPIWINTERDRTMVGESTPRICTALEGSLEYVKRLAEGILTNNGRARPTSNTTTMAPSMSSMRDEEQRNNGWGGWMSHDWHRTPLQTAREDDVKRCHPPQTNNSYMAVDTLCLNALIMIYILFLF